MNYLSTKQVSKRWGISTRRVVVLAGEGRISGAKQIDGRWFIPDNAEKPVPFVKGTNENKERRKKSDDDYIFPFFLACIQSESQIKSLTDDERALYELCMQCENGNFQGARIIAESLLESENAYVRLGALYYMPIICRYLQDFLTAEKYTLLFKTECLGFNEHRFEIELLATMFDAEMFSISDFIGHVDKVDYNVVPEDILPMICAWFLLADVIKFGTESTCINVGIYEIALKSIEKQGFFFESMYMHLCLSSYYALTKSSEKSLIHMKQAIDIAIKHETIFTLSCIIINNIETATEVLKEYPPEISNKFFELAKVYVNSANGYAEYRGENSVIAGLNYEDYKLISFCLKDCTIEKMAESLDVSRSTINNHLNALYKKVGVKTKKELNQVYTEFMMN